MTLREPAESTTVSAGPSLCGYGDRVAARYEDGVGEYPCGCMSAAGVISEGANSMWGEGMWGECTYECRPAVGVYSKHE